MPVPPAQIRNVKMVAIEMNKILVFIILNLSGYCALAIGDPKAEILWQHFFPFDNISFSYKKESLTKGIKLTVNENKISLDFHIIVEYGTNITAIADNIISTVKYKVEEFAGLEVETDNIFVEGVRVDN